MIGLVAGMREEARPVARAIRHGRRERLGAGRGSADSVLVTGVLGGRRVALAWAGAGAECAGRAAGALLERGASALLAIGFAGALAPAVRPGDVVVAAQIVEPNGTPWPADAGLLNSFAAAAHGPRLLVGPAPPSPAASTPYPTPHTQYPTPQHPNTPIPQHLNTPTPQHLNTPTPQHPVPNTQYSVHLGTLVTTPRIVAGSAEKRRLWEETGALAVDMESAVVARRAARAGVPMVALRAITDGADESLPLDFQRCFDANGQFHRSRLVRLLAHHPQAVPGLARLGRQSARAGQALTALLAGYLPRVGR